LSAAFTASNHWLVSRSCPPTQQQSGDIAPRSQFLSTFETGNVESLAKSGKRQGSATYSLATEGLEIVNHMPFGTFEAIRESGQSGPARSRSFLNKPIQK
jgi:hypothetical protein